MSIVPSIPIPSIFFPGPVGGSGSCGNSAMGVGCVLETGTELNIALPVLRFAAPPWDRGGDRGKLTAGGVEVGVEVALAKAFVGAGDMFWAIVTLAGVVVDNTFSLI